MHYLDHAATTPLRPAAIAALIASLTQVGNPSSLHAAGRAVRRTLEAAREQIAAAFGADPAELLFTSGGTEADNLAIKGLYWFRRARDPRHTRILISRLEHHAVIEAAEWLRAEQGASITWIETGPDGAVTPAALDAAIGGDPDSVALASCMWANNEIGTISPIRQLAELAAAFGIPLHTDAVQAATLPIEFGSPLAAMTITAHKLGGPIGIGALLLAREYSPVPLLHGGGQERRIRSGTLDAPGAAAFAAALAEARSDDHATLARLRDRLVGAVRAAVPDAQLNASSAHERLPGIVNIAFPGAGAESLLMLLDAADIACSAGSACTAGVARPSHVLLGLGVPEPLARASIRFSLGHTTTEFDIDSVGAVIGDVVARSRAVMAA